MYGLILFELFQVCEYAVGICTEVPMRALKRLLTPYVQAKQLLQQPIPPKTFGFEEVKTCISSMHACIPTYLPTYLPAYLSTHPHTYMHSHINTYRQADRQNRHTHTDIHTCIY